MEDRAGRNPERYRVVGSRNLPDLHVRVVALEDC